MEIFKINEVLDLAPSADKKVKISNSGNCYSYNCTKEYSDFLSEYGDKIDDFFNDFGTEAEIKEMEIRLLKRHAETSHPYYGEQYDSDRIKNDSTYKPWEDPDNYLMLQDWEPAMSSEDMKEFIKLFKKLMPIK